ncbi:hypothetical protein BH10ACI1_BH10ACI1_31560 [soil metagenome]
MAKKNTNSSNEILSPLSEVENSKATSSLSVSSRDEVLSLLNQVENQVKEWFGYVTLQEATIAQRIQLIIQEYNEDFRMNYWSPSDTQLFDIKSYLISLSESLNKLPRDENVDKSHLLTQISHYSDKLLFIINFGKSYQSAITQELSEQNRKPVTQIIESSSELDKQVQDAKKINELLQSQFEKTSSDLQASNLAQLTKFEGDKLKVINDYRTEAQEKLAQIDEFVADAEELKHYAQGKALSGFFAQRAADEKKSAANWTYLTWAFAITTLMAIGVIFYFQLNNFVQNQPADLSLLGTKVLFTATLGLVAKWTSKRANRHLSDESKYHRLAINMKTIDSFIDKLPEDAKNEIMKTVALKIFTEVNGNETATDFETASALDFIKGVLPKADK